MKTVSIYDVTMKLPATVDAMYRAHELSALGRLCEEWSKSSDAQRTLTDVSWARRMRLFRDAVISGFGKRQPIPSEILQADATVLRHSLATSGRDRGGGLKATIQMQLPGNDSSSSYSLSFPTPFTQAMNSFASQAVRDRRRNLHSILKSLLSRRYELPESTIRDALKARPRLTMTTIQQIGIHLLSTLAIAETRHNQQCDLLDSLAASGIRPIVSYYLAQHVQRVSSAAVPCPEIPVVALLCDRLLDTRGEGS